MEKIKESNNELYNIEYMRNAIYNAIDDYILDPRTELDAGLTKASQQQFDGCMSYVGRVVFNYGKLLKKPNSRFGEYDIKLVKNLSIIYIELCQLYNKVSSIQCFSYITYIDYNTLMEWLYNRQPYNQRDSELTRERLAIVKNIYNNREYSLKNKLVSSGQAVGLLGVGNHEFHWASDTIVHEERARAIALNSLPTLAQSQNNVKLSDNLSNFSGVKSDV